MLVARHPRNRDERLGRDLSVGDLEDDEEIMRPRWIRPLLADSAAWICTQYLNEIGQSLARGISSNRDLKFTRNRVRQVLLPLLEKEFNPSMAAGLGELAEIARGEEDYWQNEVAGLDGNGHPLERTGVGAAGQQDLVQIAGGPFNPERSSPGLPSCEPKSRCRLVMNVTVDLLWLLSEPVAVQRRVSRRLENWRAFPWNSNTWKRSCICAAEDGALASSCRCPWDGPCFGNLLQSSSSLPTCVLRNACRPILNIRWLSLVGP